jgi:hypothetical protein
MPTLSSYEVIINYYAGDTANLVQLEARSELGPLPYCMRLDGVSQARSLGNFGLFHQHETL